MGFLRKIIIIPGIIFVSGCAASGIKITGKIDLDRQNSMYGRVPSMDFYYPVVINDSLSLKWEAETNGSFPQSSVTYYGEYIFINDLSGRIYCINGENGKITGQLKHKGAVFTTPVINRYNVIYVETLNDEDKSFLRVYNFLEGKIKSEKEIKGRVKTEILKIADSLYFVTEKGLLYKFSDIGDQYWVTDINGEVSTGFASDNKFLYLFNNDGELLKINLSNGYIESRIKTGIPVSSGIALKNGDLFVGAKDGHLYSLDKVSGKVNWKYLTGGTIKAIPVYSKENLYTVNLAGDIVSVEASSGNVNWNINTGGLFNVTPVVTDNYIIVPDVSGNITFVDFNGNIKKIIDIPNRAKLSPVINNNLLIIGFDRGIIRAYEIL